MKHIFISVLVCVMLTSFNANSQYSAQNDAKYLATLKAVIDYKINDKEDVADVERLRNDMFFYQKLEKMLQKLSNERTKNSDNRKVYDILKKAGKDIYNILE